MDVFRRLDAVPELSHEERLLLESVRRLAREQIAPHAAQYDASSEFPWDNVRALGELGLNGIFVPESLGGAGLSYSAYLACVRELSAACASTGGQLMPPVMGIAAFVTLLVAFTRSL